MRNYIQRFKQFFQQVGTIIFPKSPTGDIGVAQARFVYFDADQATPNDEIHSGGSNLIFVTAGGVRAVITTANIDIYAVLRPNADNVRNFGSSGLRWNNGYFSSEVGVDGGAGFTDSLTDAGLTLAEQVGVVDADAESVIIGDVDHALQLPVMTTSERNAIAQQDGMMVYNSEDDEAQLSVNGTWVKLTTEAAGS